MTTKNSRALVVVSYNAVAQDNCGTGKNLLKEMLNAIKCPQQYDKVCIAHKAIYLSEISSQIVKEKFLKSFDEIKQKCKVELQIVNEQDLTAEVSIVSVEELQLFLEIRANLNQQTKLLKVERPTICEPLIYEEFAQVKCKKPYVPRKIGKVRTMVKFRSKGIYKRY